MKQAYYIMRMWQTGNIGSYNITKADNNPKEGFQTYEEAEQFMFESFDNKVWEFSDGCFYNFCIMKVYSNK